MTEKNNFGILHIVSTPIGNMEDITYRAVRILKEVDKIYCEDTRVSNKLLQYYDIDTKLYTYNDLSNEKGRNKILDELQNGYNLALISDAGTPAISDPGFKLIRSCYENDIAVTPIPGCSAPIAAISTCPLPNDKFLFIGFLPKKPNQIQKILSIYSNVSSIVCFVSNSRVIQTLQAIRDFELNQEGIAVSLFIAREITKKFEELQFCTAKEALDKYQFQEANIRGEFVMVIYVEESP